MCCKMFFIFVYLVLLLGANGQDPIFSKSLGSYCLPVPGDSDTCVFPFTFRGVEYNECAPGTCQPHLWCATSINSAGSWATWKVCGCKFGDEWYYPGEITTDTCAILQCNGTTGLFSYEGLEPNCSRCKAYLDPHIYTYDHDQNSYEYQGCGNYSLSQITNSYTPPLAIYAYFELCGFRRFISCVQNVIFKHNDQTIITIGYNTDVQINLNGEDYVLPTAPSIAHAINNDDSVLVWRGEDVNAINKKDNCVYIQGSSGFLVKFCGSDTWANSVIIWANSHIDGALKALCGNSNGNTDDDFIGRDGHNYGPWRRDAPVQFVESWLAEPTDTTDCDSSSLRVKRQTQNRCEANSTVLDDLQNQCESTISNGMSSSDKAAQGLIDDCIYDLCNVSNPNEWIKAVQEAVQIEAAIQRETQNCNCTRWCWKKSGYCTKRPENCDGRPVKDRGCDGLGCFCCIPECRNRKKECYLKGGFCTTSPETCTGDTTTGCKGQDCECCLEPDRCIPKRKCWRHGGSCIPNANFCDGKRIENACNSPHCYCCVNQPMC